MSTMSVGQISFGDGWRCCRLLESWENNMELVVGPAEPAALHSSLPGSSAGLAYQPAASHFSPSQYFLRTVKITSSDISTVRYK